MVDGLLGKVSFAFLVVVNLGLIELIDLIHGWRKLGRLNREDELYRTNLQLPARRADQSLKRIPEKLSKLWAKSGRRDPARGEQRRLAMME
jgi:hypothetical protein